MTIRLGLIGTSPGNGHPYSWAAICNGYDKKYMSECEFPVIPSYLAAEEWPAARLPKVQVTHIWTQDLLTSERIARAALIPTVVHRPEDMLGNVDGLLLARDDAENHSTFAEPFLRAGLPVYIDKPVALSVDRFDALHSLQRWSGQIFSCSALRFASELRPTQQDLENLGSIKSVVGTTPKYWETYAVHLIDPILAIVGNLACPQRRFLSSSANGGRVLGVKWGNGTEGVLMAMGSEIVSPVQLHLYGDNGHLQLTFADTFPAFRAALAEFLIGIEEGSARTPEAFNRSVVEIIEMGML